MKSVLQLRNRHFVVLDVLAILLIPAAALSIRVDGFGWWPEYARALLLFTAAALVVKMPIFYRLELYGCYWRYAGSADLVRVLVAVAVSTVVLTVVSVGSQDILDAHGLAVPRSLPLLDGMMTFLAVAGFRYGVRAMYLWQRQRRDRVGGRRVLVVGAGEAGKAAVSEMRTNPYLELEPVAFVDDDEAKLGTRIEGLPVVGTCAEIPELVEHHQVQRIVVAITSAPLGRQREIVAACEQTGLPTYSLPGVSELLAGHKTVSRTPQVEINRLLSREPVVTDQSGVVAYVRGATVLVTGAGGSIGSELCRQIARLDPAEMVLLGHGETSIVQVDLSLRLSFPKLVTHTAIVDIRDARRVERVVRRHRPRVIFHAAAHKHVPLMEEDPEEAIVNNVLGTRNVLRAAHRYGVERFVMISTDKAVNPSCVMGATKRLAELMVQAYARRSDRAYMVVRFGNVLGSRGSVIPIFQEQIAAGGPVTVTHPDMCRYFMTIPEAVQLVLQASVLGQGGEVFVLDMGQPVRIVDLATDLIKLSGLEPGRDIEIIYTGVRPGEKLSEELFLADEHCQRTEHSKILLATCEDGVGTEALELMVTELVELARRVRPPHGDEQMRTLLPMVCHYIDAKRPLGRPYPLEPAPERPGSALAGSSPASGAVAPL